MKHQIARILLQVSFLAVVAAGAGVEGAHGQSLSTHVLAKIPFDFSVGDKKFPAGEYSVGRALSGSDDTVLQVSSVNGNLTAFRLTSENLNLARKGSDTLVFHQYGDQYFLSEVWPAGGTVGRTLLESRGERAAHEGMAKNKIATQRRTVAVTGGAQ
jgi:hypothetical protein